jgi:hypothetical protein
VPEQERANTLPVEIEDADDKENLGINKQMTE